LQLKQFSAQNLAGTPDSMPETCPSRWVRPGPDRWVRYARI